MAVMATACVAVDDGMQTSVGLPTTTEAPASTAPASASEDLPVTTQPADDDVAVGSLDELDPSTTTTEPLDMPAPVLVTDVPPNAGAWGETVVLVEAFFAEEFAAFAGGGEYRPLDRNRIVAVDDGDDDLPACTGQDFDSSDVEQNAFAAVCPEGQLIMWDDDDLFVALFERYGATGPAIVIAHEFAHAVEFQAGTLNQATVVIEQQADCLAGSFARWMSDRSLAPFDVPSSLDAAVGSTVSFRDQPGTSANNANAHGSGFDRVRAFQDGFEGGVELCAEYNATFLGPRLTQIQFSTTEDAATGGNLGFEALIELVNPYFSAFYGRLADIGTFTLTPADLVQWRQLHNQLGDNATGTAMALEYGAEVQRQLGLPDEGVDAFLQQTCLAGAAFRPLISTVEGIDTTGISLSAGDMDEAVLTLSRIVELNQDVLEPGFLFEAVGSLRTGFFDSDTACGLG